MPHQVFTVCSHFHRLQAFIFSQVDTHKAQHRLMSRVGYKKWEKIDDVGSVSRWIGKYVSWLGRLRDGGDLVWWCACSDYAS